MIPAFYNGYIGADILAYCNGKKGVSIPAYYDYIEASIRAYYNS
jgi:hypothetical protein